MNTSKYDLHCHSDQSDGILSPESLVSRAKAQEVDVLAITDHDTVSGIARAKVQAQCEGITLITGIEFSTLWAGRNIHIVGLNVDVASASLQKAVAAQEQRRDMRAHMIDEKLAAVGIVGALAGARNFAGEGGVVGRPHFAQHLIATGVVRTMEQAFKRYLGAGKPGDVKQLWPDIGDAVSAINHAGGVAVIAHPAKYPMTRTKLCTLIEDFVACGGQAIEVVSGKQDTNQSMSLAKIADKYQLLASQGSDFHSPVGPWSELGCCTPLPDICEPVWRNW